MFKQLFGNYLVSSGKISKAQYQIASEKQANSRVKLGLIAVADKLITQEQADELNQLQTQMDKRFGDIAVEKGYLTDEQVGGLLKKQGNEYLQFIQTLTESGFLTLNDIDECLKGFIEETGYTKEQIETLKSGDVTGITSLFTGDDDKLLEILSMVLRNVTRFITTDYFICEPEEVESVKFKCIEGQDVIGDDNFTVAFVDTEGDRAFTHVSSLYAKTKLDAGSAESFDAIGEFINCINGLYVSSEAGENSNIDMEPPFGYKEGTVSGDVYIVPINIAGVDIKLMIAIGSKPQITGQHVEVLEITEVEAKNEGGKRILIVDDSRMSRKVLRDVLEGAGYSVVAEAKNGIDAVKYFAKCDPDLVTLDITMPELDGIGALKEILNINPNAKVIMVSAAGMKAKVVEAIKLGAKEFITKPIEKDTVLKIIGENI